MLNIKQESGVMFWSNVTACIKESNVNVLLGKKKKQQKKTPVNYIKCL